MSEPFKIQSGWRVLLWSRGGLNYLSGLPLLRLPLLKGEIKRGLLLLELEGVRVADPLIFIATPVPIRNHRLYIGYTGDSDMDNHFK